jgi:CrcB protein
LRTEAACTAWMSRTAGVYAGVVTGEIPQESLPRPLGPGSRIALLFLGGALGTLLRFLATGAPLPLSAPAQLMATNLAGALFLGVLLGAVQRPTRSTDALRAFFGTGLLGGFTSYSAMAATVLPGTGHVFTGALFALCTVIVGTLCALIGLALGGKLSGRHFGNRTEPPGGEQL